MPLFLSPAPQRIRITRQNFTVPPRPTLQVDPALGPEADVAAAWLTELFPEIQRTRKMDVPAEIRLLPLEGEMADGRPRTVDSLRLSVTEAGIVLAGGPRGLLYGVELIRQLAGEGDVIGVQIEDWPAFAVRELYVSLPPDALAPSYWPRLLDNLARWRFNRLSLTDAPGSDMALAAARAAGEPLGIEIATGRRPDSTETNGQPCPLLLEAGDGGVVRPARLEAIREAALQALAGEMRPWCVDAGAVDAETFLDTLAYGLAFAGACGWNPRKTELKAHRRSFAAHFFGPEAAGAQEALEALEAGLATAEEALPGEAAPLDALFWEPPFAPERFRRMLRGGERSREIASLAERAQAAIETARESATRSGAALGLLEWPVRRMGVQVDHLLTMQRVREGYAGASLAEGSPKAVSQRVLSAAEMLEGLANRVSALDELRLQLWPLERDGEPPEAARRPYQERIDLLRGKSKELRDARDRYIQTGRLAAPDAIGLGRDRGGQGRAVLPGRLPPRHSPAWWIDGGVARVRMETGYPPAAETSGRVPASRRDLGGSEAAKKGAKAAEKGAETAGIPWEVLIDFRGLAGDEGTFNVRRARLVRFDDATDAIGPLVPCQLTRGGLVFIPQPGEQAYYLYLDPTSSGEVEPLLREEGPAPLRARQSREGITVEGPLLAARVDALRGVLDRWRAGGTGGEELVDASAREAGLCQLPDTPLSGPPRVRVIENGPLLVRVRAESEEGRVRQYDFLAGVPWCEFSVNAPVTLVRHALAAELWQSGEALFPVDGTGAPRPLDGTVVTAPWAARVRADGLAFAVLAPEGPARHELTPDRHDLLGAPDLKRLVLWCRPAGGGDPAVAARLEALGEALQHPPIVQFGPVEERRTREF